MAYHNDTYITDGLVYTTYCLNEFGDGFRVSDMYEGWVAKGPNTHKRTHKIMSYDNGYVVNQIVDVRVVGQTELMILSTRNDRKVYVTHDSTLLTDRGMLNIASIGIGTKLKVVDNYKGYRGDKIKLDTGGNGRVRALLRAHGVPFELAEFGGTETPIGTVYCQDYDLAQPVTESNRVTFGLNNYREGLKAMLHLPEYTFDEVISIKPKFKQFTVGVYVSGPQNVVLVNGMIVQSTQTEARNA